jgi:hypothetical protein
MDEAMKKLILKELEAGESVYALVKKLGVPRSTLRDFRKKQGIKAAKRKLAEPLKVVNGKIECPKCGKPQDEDDFIIRPRSVRRCCKFCEYWMVQKRLSSSLDAYMKHKASTLKSMAKKKNLPYDLSWGFLVRLHGLQKGLCFYTDEPLHTERGRGHSKQSLSVDKILPEAGYTKENVVLCTYKANVVKNDLTLDEIERWLPGWYKRIEDRRESQCWLKIC